VKKPRRTAVPEENRNPEPTPADLDRLIDALELKAVKDGNPQAAALVVSLAARLCVVARSVAILHPKVADEIARVRTNWPLLCEDHPDLLRRNLRWLKALPLGENTGWKKANPRKPYSLRTVANSTVHIQIQSIALSRAMAGRPLDDLSFDLVWAEICRNRAPEKEKHLRPLGIAFAEKKRDTCPKDTRSYESNVRDGIKQRLRAAFGALVKSQEMKG
jgi:hypothetical protein